MKKEKRTFEESYQAIRSSGGDAWDDLNVNQELAAMRGQPQGIEADVCNDITERQALGMADPKNDFSAICECGKPQAFNEITKKFCGCCKDCMPF